MPAPLTLDESANMLYRLAKALRTTERSRTCRRLTLHDILIADTGTQNWHIDPARLIRAALTNDSDKNLLTALETRTGGTIGFTVEATPNNNFGEPTETGTYHIDLCLNLANGVTLRVPFNTVTDIAQNGFTDSAPISHLAHFGTEGTCETAIDVDPTGQPIAITCTRHGCYQAN